MKIDNNNVREIIASAKKMLATEKRLSPALRAIINLLLVFMEAMLGRFGINSSNSSKPPAQDPNRKKKSKKNSKDRKPGGQPGRLGKQLKPVSDPDVIETLVIDKRTLPKGNYKDAGFEVRQVIDIEVSIVITEYRGQILTDDGGKRYVAEFPEFVTRPIQYGSSVKANSVYMSQYQLLPYKRIEDYFAANAGLNISAGSLFNFNKEAYAALEQFEIISKEKLINKPLLHVDETGINVNGKRIWLHTACDDKWTHFAVHEKRGVEAMNAIGIIPKYKGILCHDHWKPYYTYTCPHALCNAHHLRELEWSATEDKQVWAGRMKKFLLKLNEIVKEAGGILPVEKSKYYSIRYDKLLNEAQLECPPPEDTREKGKRRGRIKRSKSRNLLERLINYKDDVLRFMYEVNAPFTNNQGENDLRMTKVQQKISGCFRSEEGARIFCRIRGYLNTCRKHNITSLDALKTLFVGKLPAFVNGD